MVNVGIIGLGSHWDRVYAPLLRKFRSRIAVRAVYDPIAERAEHVADEWEAAVSHGMLSLLERTDVRAVLLLDMAWYGHEALHLIRAQHKPAYIAGRLGDDADRLSQHYEAAQSEGLMLMPELGSRYTPSTARLRELIATRIGRPHRVSLEVACQGEWIEGGHPDATCMPYLVDLFDWCRYVVRSVPLRLCAKRGDNNGASSGPNLSIAIEYAEPRDGGARPVADIHLLAASRASDAPECSLTAREVQCERGRAILPADADISWATSAKPSESESVTESLQSDRPATEVMLDHFCRRVSGGLIPVADIADVCLGLNTARAIDESLLTGASVDLC